MMGYSTPIVSPDAVRMSSPTVAEIEGQEKIQRQGEVSRTRTPREQFQFFPYRSEHGEVEMDGNGSGQVYRDGRRRGEWVEMP
jgi:hypothetical protein